MADYTAEVKYEIANYELRIRGDKILKQDRISDDTIQFRALLNPQ